MQLFIDAGNTRAKWMLVDTKGGRTKGELSLNHLSGEHVAADLQNNQNTISEIFIACVASSSTEKKLTNWCEQQFAANLHLIMVENHFAGLRLCYSDISTLGIDRWLCMLAVAHQNAIQREDLAMIIDAGTAITVDFLTGRAEHLGGFISPGCQMMLDSLGAKTSRVGLNEQFSEFLQSKLGQSTQGCVEQGIRAAVEGVVLKGIEAPEQLSLPWAPTLVCVTGGDQATVQQIIEDHLNGLDDITKRSIKVALCSELVFEGMIAYAAIMKTRNV